eukprot:TRINITY_DN11000_c0_g1_i1.p2 TRINITY_DN11000_c0_g1~~TRINITY_DN11000_c0_g1_i1.p2  ORF type:complete len:413 (+),score=87.17 TRINITY_DN11000_c0_g1_i1:2366-3604(+)
MMRQAGLAIVTVVCLSAITIASGSNEQHLSWEAASSNSSSSTTASPSSTASTPSSPTKPSSTTLPSTPSTGSQSSSSPQSSSVTSVPSSTTSNSTSASITSTLHSSSSTMTPPSSSSTTPAASTNSTHSSTLRPASTTSPEPTTAPGNPERGALIAVYPSTDCNLAGFNSQIFFIHAPETNASCQQLADTNFFYKLALETQQRKILYAKLDCKDSTCANCGVDTTTDIMGQCARSTRQSSLSFIVRPEAEELCLGGVSKPDSKDMIEVLYQNAVDDCNAGSHNITVTNIGPVDGQCQAQPGSNLFRQLSYVNSVYEYASDCLGNVGADCDTCQRAPKVFKLGECLTPDPFGRVQVMQASKLSACPTAKQAGNSHRAGLVAGLVIAALFVVIIAFFMYIRHQRKSGGTYEAIQ